MNISHHLPEKNVGSDVVAFLRADLWCSQKRVIKEKNICFDRITNSNLILINLILYNIIERPVIAKVAQRRNSLERIA